VIYDNPQITPDAIEFREAMAELANLYHRTRRYEQAIAQLEEITQRYPSDERLGQMYFLMADSYRKSAGMLDARLMAAKGETGTTRPSFNLEEAMAERKSRLERASRSFKTVVEIYKASGAKSTEDKMYEMLAYFYQADCVYDLGQYADAIKLYDEAAFRYQNDPSALAAYVQIVNANVALGKLDEAKAANERAKWMLRRMPNDTFKGDVSVMSQASWDKWLEWSTQSGLWK